MAASRCRSTAEVDITSSSIDRIDIYRVLRVPEVWRYHGDVLTVLVLQADGRYRELERSPTFPDVPLDVVTDFVRQGRNGLTAQAVWDFEAWLRARPADG